MKITNPRVKVGTDGVFLRSGSPLIAGHERAHSIADIMAACTTPSGVEEGLRWAGAKIPADIMKDVLGTIQQFPNRETAYELMYNLFDSQWKIECPEQKGAGAVVDYTTSGFAPGGFVTVGTIHTHPEMGAFWSGTDLHDHMNKFGLHMVFGLKDGKVAQHLCTIFTKTGNKYDVNISDIMDDVDFAANYHPREDWVEIINKQHTPQTLPSLLPSMITPPTVYKTSISVEQGWEAPMYHMTVDRALDVLHKHIMSGDYDQDFVTEIVTMAVLVENDPPDEQTLERINEGVF